eukprot:Nk52_evm16s370 gene=Nk52_evmTU16s370
MSFLFSGRRNKKPAVDGKKLYLEPNYVNETIVTGDLRSVVVLPEGEKLNEWLATNTISFFNHCNLFYGTVSELCTPQSCPAMTVGPKMEYSWIDDKGKKVKSLSASQYIDFVMTHIQKQVNQESIFPSRFGTPFPPDFLTRVKKIFKLLFHVFAHIYYAHFQHIVDLEEAAHLNTLFSHFIFFCQEFALVDSKELAPLADLIKVLQESS